MTDERSRYDGDPPHPSEPLVNTLPCERCGEPSTHFSPHSKEPLCWLCAAVEEEEQAAKMLPKFGTAMGRDIYELMERHRDRCYRSADPERKLEKLVHRVRCNVTLSSWRGVDPLEVLERMLEE